MVDLGSVIQKEGNDEMIFGYVGNQMFIEYFRKVWLMVEICVGLVYRREIEVCYREFKLIFQVDVIIFGELMVFLLFYCEIGTLYRILGFT